MFFLATEQPDEVLQEEINKAHVVCVVYSVEDDSSIDRITSHWLPTIRESTTLDQRKPVVLVGNKIDLVDFSTIDVRAKLKFALDEQLNYFKFSFKAIAVDYGRLSGGGKLR